ncbi:LysR family transcriptional regulator [[Mannheimia] succiniciproducens]|uniref:LysR protein n=1 Tax=Mannheimia succiniciproducens (strain KCTC 0769BP / MBEL55E) TaxID=221988 RepID=Q65VR7_MANSM|nr:LysR family transcriptional regulator [[Mannheimia] succiniciproducens]AAU36943.1 LysR protein [[Mannheimia] succiniciproducens MBEL55E]
MLKDKKTWPLIEDLNVFLTIIRKNSFSGAAKELGQSNSYITKRINILEDHLHTSLFYRNTRNIKLTAAGEYVQNQAIAIIDKMDSLMTNIVEDKKSMFGHLHICSSFGFGRTHLAKPISLFAKQHPNLSLDLTLTDHKLDLIKENIDLEIAVGNDLNDRYFAKKLANNRRILCASPDYLQSYGLPKKVEQLSKHNCLFLKEKNSSFGVWKLFNGKILKSITVNGGLTTNNGEVILQWALEGHGIIYRSLWDAEKYLISGELVHILPEYYEDAPIWVVYPNKLSESLKTEIFVNFLTEYFAKKELTKSHDE